MLLSEFLELLDRYDGESEISIEQNYDDGSRSNYKLREIAVTVDDGYVTLYLEDN